MVGCPHSGTTITMSLFANHPKVKNASEKNTFWEPTNYFEKWSDHIKTQDDVDQNEKERIRSRLQFILLLSGKERILNKDPNNSVRIKYLKAIFPDCKIIHIIRDGRAVVNSLISSQKGHWEREDRFKSPEDRINPWPGVKPPDWENYLSKNPYEQHAYQWLKTIQFARETAPSYDDYLEIKYEDLCSSPKKSMKKLFEFSNLEPVNGALDKASETLVSKNYKWKKQLDSKTKRLVTDIQEDLLKELNYSN